MVKAPLNLGWLVKMMFEDYNAGDVEWTSAERVNLGIPDRVKAQKPGRWSLSRNQISRRRPAMDAT